MFVAKIQSKEKYPNGIKVNVLFTDGVESFTESCTPSDNEGFKYWVKSRLDTFNAVPVIDSLYNDGDVVLLNEAAVEVVLTPEEIAANEWLAKYRRWVRIKTTLVDTNILTLTHPRLQSMLTELKSGLLPEYINLI